MKPIQTKELRCFDNGGESLDRYTIIGPRRCRREHSHNGVWECISSSERPFHPQGFGQSCSAVPGKHLGKRIAFDALPADVRKFACQSYDIEQ